MLKHYGIFSLFFALLLSMSAVFAEEEKASSEAGKFSVDFTQTQGPIKALNGTNTWTPIHAESIWNWHEYAQKARFSSVRLHDCPLIEVGLRVVDVPQIFGNAKADPSDPDNYYFDATDYYLKQIIVEGKSQVIYRLGNSIEHCNQHFYAFEPKDPEKFAEVCAGIVRHYNQKWADGFEWNIQYWEIWNEPDLVPQMWNTRDFQTYCRFYCIVANRLRKEFPDIKIGGPAICSANQPELQMLLDECKATGAPLDFCSWHCYSANPEDLLITPSQVKKLLDDNGFSQTELHLNEWHYFPASWSEMHGTDGGAETREYKRRSPEGLNGYDSAAFVGYLLTRWQDTPLTMSNYYMTCSETWGLLSGEGLVRKPYYVFIAFADLLEQAPERVQTTDCGYVSLLGGIGKEGQKVLFVS
ncbi:MAG: hypothetical protein IKW74_08265, partial [Thermoguttaceae bacterium]|nr:hypothetical protein [Thermoguttaceae bacterium]